MVNRRAKTTKGAFVTLTEIMAFLCIFEKTYFTIHIRSAESSMNETKP